jgi:hypothetical protein
MAKKRFTDCEKWQDEWFSELKPEYKLAWLYILDTCTNAGRWKKNFKALNFFCGINITEQEFKKVFKDRIIEQDGYFFIPKFLKFQYPNGLNSEKKAIKSVVNELKEYNLLEIVNQMFGDEFIMIDNQKNIKKQRKNNKSLIDKGLISNQSVIDKVSIQEKEKDKDKEKEKEKEKDKNKGDNKGDDKVNWDNCRNDNQRLMAFWVQLEHPELYKNATKEQAQEFFKRFTRDSSSILKMAGNLEVAKEAVKACREWLSSKKLEYNLTTIARNIGKFIDEAIRKYQLPPETDLYLLAEYQRLYKEIKSQEISQMELVKAIKQRMKETGKSINEILEEAVKKIKQKVSSEIGNSEIGNVIKNLADKISINQEAK